MLLSSSPAFMWFRLQQLHHDAAAKAHNQIPRLLLSHITAEAELPTIHAKIITLGVAIAAWAELAGAALLLWQAAGRCWVAYHWPHRLLALTLLVALLVLLAPQVLVYQLLWQLLHLQQTIPANHTQQND